MEFGALKTLNVIVRSDRKELAEKLLIRLAFREWWTHETLLNAPAADSRANFHSDDVTWWSASSDTGSGPGDPQLRRRHR